MGTRRTGRRQTLSVQDPNGPVNHARVSMYKSRPWLRGLAQLRDLVIILPLGRAGRSKVVGRRSLTTTDKHFLRVCRGVQSAITYLASALAMVCGRENRKYRPLLVTRSTHHPAPALAQQPLE
jgi:hypothetical protein